MEIEAGKLQTEAKEYFGEGRFANCQKHLWNLIEHPTSSCTARVGRGYGMVFLKSFDLHIVLLLAEF